MKFQPLRSLGRSTGLAALDRTGAHRPLKLLLPVSPLFIVSSLIGAFLLNLLPWGRWVAVPDWLALTLVFWSMHQPRRVGIGTAFLLGLCMDVHDATLLGEHALAYSLLSYTAIALHRRVLWFPLGGQMLHVLPMLLLAQTAVIIVRVFNGAPWPSAWFLLESISATLLWPVATWVLLAPQRRPLDKDATRPL